ncbi:MAG: hypothetical protein GY841_18545 [FCB group bacterium]|nr:hypothetical protein [FCB group bacterium]
MNQAIAVKDSVDRMLTSKRSELVKCVPAGVDQDRLMRVCMNVFLNVPKISECTPASIFQAIVNSLAVGLEPNSATQQAYLVPFRDNRSGTTKAQFMPSYRGLIDLCRRSGEMDVIYAAAVHEKDPFKVTKGTSPSIFHEPELFSERGKIFGYYAVITYRNGSKDFEVMTMAEIDKVRKTSKSGGSGPWGSWPEEMAKKTVLKRLLKRCPVSTPLANAVELDHRASMGDPQACIANERFADIIEKDAVVEAEVIKTREHASDMTRRINEESTDDGGEMDNTAKGSKEGQETVGGQLDEWISVIARCSSMDDLAALEMELDGESSLSADQKGMLKTAMDSKCEQIKGGE